jgi:hypothetical protein
MGIVSRGQEERWQVENITEMHYIYNNSIMKPTKNCLKGGGSVLGFRHG